MVITLFEPSYEPTKNMSRDLELIALSKKHHCAVLRLYGWDRPTLSIGRLQKAHQILNLALLQAEQIPLVIRPTGGRAVLHIPEEITYSFAFHAGLSHHYGTTVNDTYCIIAQALLEGLHAMGIDASFATKAFNRHSALKEQKLPCYLSTVPHEIEITGKKLIGSAQLRLVDGVLQHGSIPLADTYQEIVRYELGDLRTQEERLKRLRVESCSLYSSLGRVATFEEIAQPLAQAFQREFISHCSF